MSSPVRPGTSTVANSPAVEARDVLVGDRSAGVHDGQQFGGVGGEAVRMADAGSDHLGKHGVGQQPHVFGKQAEQQLHQVMRRPVRVFPAALHALGNGAEPAGGVLGDFLHRDRRA